MNDDLNILITFVSTSKTLDKVAIKIPHGMNEFDGWEFYREDDVWQHMKRFIPPHVQTFIDFVVDVEEIFEIKEH